MVEFKPVIERRRHAEGCAWTYSALDAYQRALAENVSQGKFGALLLSEVAPVITLGKRADARAELTLPVENLRALGIEIFPTDRGGFATYHGPGQWVLFWVEKLERLTGDSRGVRKWVDALLRASANTLAEFSVDARIGDGDFAGVWSPRGKIVSCGIAVKNGVVLHGISVNGFAHPLSFIGLRPCGLEVTPDGRPMQMDYALQGPEKFEFLGERLIANVMQESQRLS